MTNIFVIGSPLSCLFANLVARRFAGDENVAYFEPAQPHYPASYPAIDRLMEARLAKRPLTELDTGRRYERLFIAHRFQVGDVRTVFRLRGKVGSINLHDGEMSLYTGHKHNKQRKNDHSLRLRLKNAAKALIGRPPSHVYMRQIDCVYSVFPEVADCPTDVRRASILEDFCAAAPARSDLGPAAIVLSHPFVFDRYLGLEEYSGYLETLAARLGRVYSTVYFKAHPLEATGPVPQRVFAGGAYERLPVDYDAVPVELLLAQQRQIDVFGFWSGAMIYAAGALGVRVRTLYPDLLAGFPDRPRLAGQFAAMWPLMQRHGVAVFETAEAMRRTA